MVSFPCLLCPCPKSKLLVFYSNFFSAIHTRTVELKPREDIHTGTEGNDLTRMVEACHLWGSLVTECPSHWSRGDCKRGHDGMGGLQSSLLKTKIIASYASKDGGNVMC